MFLDKSIPINTIAWIPNNPVSPLPAAIYFSGSSEYNQNLEVLVGNVISTTNTPYLITQISASYIPDASGWYILETYGADPNLLFWETNGDTWDNANYTWDSAGLTTGALNEIRIYVSGSNTPSFIGYLSSNETGSFIRYVSANETASFTTYISNNESGSFTRYTSSNETASFNYYNSSNENAYFTTYNS